VIHCARPEANRITWKNRPVPSKVRRVVLLGGILEDESHVPTGTRFLPINFSSDHLISALEQEILAAAEPAIRQH